MLIFVIILVVGIAAINIFIGSKFIADKNSKRYSLYRVVGAKNRDITVVMLVESLFAVVISFFVGVFVERVVFKPLIREGAFPTLNIKDYVALFFINLSAVLITTGILIFKKLYFAPMEAKQRGKQ